MGKKKGILELVRNDPELLAAHAITPEELDMVGRIELFGTLKSVEDLLFVLELSRRYREN
jgi:hypothetical protein